VCREKQNCKIGKKLGEILNWVASDFFKRKQREAALEGCQFRMDCYLNERFFKIGAKTDVSVIYL
jgi:hypothetical protein